MYNIIATCSVTFHVARVLTLRSTQDATLSMMYASVFEVVASIDIASFMLLIAGAPDALYNSRWGVGWIHTAL
jgi:hypothetical protein